jgi:hypothetical protein
MMLKQRHRQEAFDTELSVADEARIREDERRRVLAELASDDHDADWRNAPPPVGETRVEDPSDVPSAPGTTDPRRWDIPDDRWEAERRGVTVAPDERTAVVPAGETAVVEDDTVTERGFSPGQILIVLAGAAALALGIAAVARTGLEAPLSEPVEPVLGWDHTALLGLIEIGAGALLILSGLRAGARWIGGLIGIAAIVGGALILGRADWATTELGAEREFGWVAIAIGAVAVVGAAIPRVRRTRRVSTTRSMLT